MTACRTCGQSLTIGSWPFCPHGRVEHTYHPFKPYFDLGLGAYITSFGQRETLRKRLKCDFIDQPSPGDLSARRDRIAQDRRDRASKS